MRRAGLIAAGVVGAVAPARLAAALRAHAEQRPAVLPIEWREEA